MDSLPTLKKSISTPPSKARRVTSYEEPLFAPGRSSPSLSPPFLRSSPADSMTQLSKSPSISSSMSRLNRRNKFTDDQIVDSRSLDLDKAFKPKPQPLSPVAMSELYRTHSTLDHKTRIEDGFVDYFDLDSPPAPTMWTPYDHQVSKSEYFGVVYDQKSDAWLYSMVSKALALCASLPTAELKVRILALIVSDCLGGSLDSGRSVGWAHSAFVHDQTSRLDSHWNSSSESNHSLSNSSSSLSTSSSHSPRSRSPSPPPSPHNVTFTIGELVTSKTQLPTRIRAALFKYLADKVGLAVSLQKLRATAGHPDSECHAWNQLYSADDPFAQEAQPIGLVDLFTQAGQIIPTGPEAFTYQHLSTIPAELAKRPLWTGSRPTLTSSAPWIETPNLASIEYISVLGAGKFGTVHKVSLGGFLCAEKVIKTTSMSEEQRAYLRREHSIIRYLKHKNIVSLLGLQTESDHIRVFLELSTTSLNQILASIHSGKRPPMSSKELLIVIQGVLEGLAYLSSRNVIHRDIKSHNILVNLTSPIDPSGVVLPGHPTIENVKICDFGLAKILQQGKTAKKAVGSRRWMAPEVQSGAEYSGSADIWSFGMLVLELLTLQSPYSELCVLDVKQQVLQGLILRQLLDKCLKFDPTERPTAQELLTFVRQFSPSSPSK